MLVLIELWLLKNLVLDRILLATEEAGFDRFWLLKVSKKHMKIRVVRLLILIELWLLKNLVFDRVLATEEGCSNGIMATKKAGFHRFWLFKISKST